MRELQGITRVISLGDQEALDIRQLLNVQTDNQGLILQFFAHGGYDGIAHTPGGNLIPWNILVELVSSCRTKYPIRLEVLGVCNSKYITNHLSANSTIDQIWVTTEFTTWQSVYNNSRNFFTFVEFLNDLENDPQGSAFIPTYREIRWGNFFRPIE